MNFKSEKLNLLKAINSVINGIANKRDTILEGILIEADNEEVKFTTYNEEIGIEYKIPALVNKTGSIVVKAYTFSEIIRRLPDIDINIYVDETTELLTIECGGSEYKLATMNAANFPEIPKVDPESKLKIQQKDLKANIKQTIFAVGTDDKRPIYTGMLFDVEKNHLNIVAIDGCRVAVRSADVVSDSSFKMVIPGRTLSEVSKILNDSFDEVEIGFSKNQGVFVFDNCKITTKILEGEFLSYKEVIKSRCETTVRINRNELLDSFERVMLISASNTAKEKRSPVEINIEIGKIIISCITAVGSAKEEIYVETEGKEIKLQFNPKFFLDVLKNVSDEEIIIDFATSKTPTIIKPVENDGEYTYVILPIQTRN